jgi:hypothetical protein
MGKKNKGKSTKGSADGPAVRAFTGGCGTIAIGVVLLFVGFLTVRKALRRPSPESDTRVGRRPRKRDHAFLFRVR